MVAFYPHLLAVGLTLPQIAPPVPHIVAARVPHLATARVPFSPVAVLADDPTTEAAIYSRKEKELPKIAGGVKVGTKRIVVITGASSGLGLSATKALVGRGGYFVVAAVRDPAKMDAVAKEAGIARAGVMFDHGFQLSTFVLALLCIHYGA